MFHVHILVFLVESKVNIVDFRKSFCKSLNLLCNKITFHISIFNQIIDFIIHFMKTKIIKIKQQLVMRKNLRIATLLLSDLLTLSPSKSKRNLFIYTYNNNNKKY